MILERLGLWGLAVALCAGATGCEPTPREDYDDFRARTAERRELRPDMGVINSSYQDLEGRWLLQASLKGGIALGLRIEFVRKGALANPDELEARIWLERQTYEEAPLLVTSTSVAEDGTFLLVADPLNLGTEIIRSESPVLASVIMNSRTLTADNWCGDAEGSVKSPLNLNLTGSTFSAHRDDDPDAPLVAADLPFRCTDLPEPELPDAGVSDGGEVERPESPDLSAIVSTTEDLTGHWLLQTRVLGITLNLWLSLIYSGDEMGGQIDGAVRLASAENGSEALSTFTTVVDAEGRFEVWLPEFDLDLVSGAILLGAATLGPDRFCGEAAGSVMAIGMDIDLAGTAFNAERWTHGDDLPQLQEGCTEE